jgi:quercetin 2,3-dioxygenase
MKLTGILLTLALAGATLSTFLLKDNHPSSVEEPQAALREVIQVVDSRQTKSGPLIMKQPLPLRGLDQIDPFLLIHHHGPAQLPPNNPGLPFGPHPHRGFETVTLIYHGDVTHRDSEGFESTIETGGIQYMTAGKGIVHSERSSQKFKRDGGKLEMIQLWVNLPARLKFSEPRYEGFEKETLPMVKSQDGKTAIQVVSGAWDNVKSPAQGAYPVHLYTLDMQAGAQLEKIVLEAENVFLYVLNGDVRVNGTAAKTFQMVQFGNKGERVSITASTPARLLMGHGMPIGEPMVSYGPFVMNTMEEIQEAMEDYTEGRMGILTEQ